MEAFVAGRVIKGPMQVDFITWAGDAQGTGVVSTEGEQEGALSGRTWRLGKNKKEYTCIFLDCKSLFFA